MMLVPDLATDLGTPNEDFTEWTFTIRDDVKWEAGDPVTAEEVAFGIKRSLDSEHVPVRPRHRRTPSPTSTAATSTRVPTPTRARTSTGDHVRRASDITIKMAKPFPDMDYWGTFMAMGPVPLGSLRAAGLRPRSPLSTGPYKIEKFTPEPGARPGQERPVGPGHRPGPSPVRRQVHLQVRRRTRPGRRDRCSATTPSRRRRSSTAIRLGQLPRPHRRPGRPPGAAVGPQPCTSFSTPDYTKITDIKVRKALAYAYPYEDVWPAAGEVPGSPDPRPGRTRSLPPGMAGASRTTRSTVSRSRSTRRRPRSSWPRPATSRASTRSRLVYDDTDPRGRGRAGADRAGLTRRPASRSSRTPYSGDQPLRRLDRPGQQDQQEAQPARRQLVLGLAVGFDVIPPLLADRAAAYNTGVLLASTSVDDEIDDIETLPLEEQADAWGALDEKIDDRVLSRSSRPRFQQRPVGFGDEDR